MEKLRDLLYREVKKIHVQRFPYNDFLFDYVEETDA
jgi:GTP-binding protein HflX